MLYFLYIIYIVLLKIVRHVRQNSCIPTESKAEPCLTDFSFTRQAFCDPLLRVSQKSVSQLSYVSKTKTYIPLIAYIFQCFVHTILLWYKPKKHFVLCDICEENAQKTVLQTVTAFVINNWRFHLHQRCARWSSYIQMHF